MPLVGWETHREGIEDYRYPQMLEDCVTTIPNDPVAVPAEQWIATCGLQ